jgi:hypothetical protein
MKTERKDVPWGSKSSWSRCHYLHWLEALLQWRSPRGYQHDTLGSECEKGQGRQVSLKTVLWPHDSHDLATTHVYTHT